MEQTEQNKKWQLTLIYFWPDFFSIAMIASRSIATLHELIVVGTWRQPGS